MEFSLAVMKNENQFMIHKFSTAQDESSDIKVIDFQSLDELNPDALLYDIEFQESSVLQHVQAELGRYFPIRSSQELSLETLDLEKLSFEQGKLIYQKINNHWCLKHNLQTLENIFTLTEHLKSLYPNNRTEFFEELWELLRKNLGASFLSLTYNDASPEKNKLKQVIVEGSIKSNPRVAKEIEVKIFSDYEKYVTPRFEVVEYDSVRSELVATVSIKNSPVLLMAKTATPTTLQKTLLRALISGLNLS